MTSTSRSADQAARPILQGQRVIPSPTDAPLALRRVLLRTRAVTQCVGLSRSQIYALAAEGKFPKPVKHASNLSVWPSDEIESWIDARVAERDATLTAVRPQQGGRGHD